MIVSMGSPEAMEQFSASEIGDTNGNGYPRVSWMAGAGRSSSFGGHRGFRRTRMSR